MSEHPEQQFERRRDPRTGLWLNIVERTVVQALDRDGRPVVHSVGGGGADGAASGGPENAPEGASIEENSVGP